jgi:hypothetical protein
MMTIRDCRQLIDISLNALLTQLNEKIVCVTLPKILCMTVLFDTLWPEDAGLWYIGDCCLRRYPYRPPWRTIDFTAVA